MKITMYGTGGVGGYFGTRLAQAGNDVSFIARGEHLRSIQTNGLKLKSIKGDHLLRHPKATEHPQEIGSVDVVFVCVKTWQVTTTAEAIKPLIGPDTLVIPTLNGVEAVDQLSAALGADHVIGGVAKIFSYIEQPGVIAHIGHEPALMLGEVDGSSSARVQALGDTIEKAGIIAELPEQIMSAVWSKFIFTSGWGGLGAISRAPIGILRSEPKTRTIIDDCMQETESVARAKGVDLPSDIVQRTWDFIDGLEPTGTTSLQRDIATGRPSELDAWNGAVVRIGKQLGVATPTHELITSALTPLEKRARGKLDFS